MKEAKFNDDIDADQVYLIDQDGQSQGVIGLDQAKYLAFEAGLDLVQASSSNPPVVKIMDYGKYRYAQEKLASKQKVKTKSPEIKEIRISLKINAHDFDFKAKQAQKFLADGDKVKVALKLIGREMMFQDRTRKVLDDFKTASGGQFEGPVERMGSRFSVILVKSEPKEIKKDEAKNQ